jgi:hypothetical protein
MHDSARTDQLHRELEQLGSKVGDLERALGRLTAIVADRLPPDAPNGTGSAAGIVVLAAGVVGGASGELQATTRMPTVANKRANRGRLRRLTRCLLASGDSDKRNLSKGAAN